jgi:hypothetical protein
LISGALGVAGDLFGDFSAVILVLFGIGIGIAVFAELTRSSLKDDDY